MSDTRKRPTRSGCSRFVCIHGHFYQPPRENPWLETVEIQDSAYPFHDWNRRVTAECYAPNADSRILDEQGRIDKIVNNYARISFNFGPTLLAWMEDHEPAIYRAILEADRDSRQRFSGHGSALAQVYNHLILPLASPRDKRTQVIWGVRDFEHRFGRRPEGMWLAETAVDTDSLEALAEAGMRFTILAPNQAAAVRPCGATEWRAVDEGTLDTTRPYRVGLPSKREIVVFFYDGPVSRALAFERLLASGESFVARLLSRFDEDRSTPQLVHVATDGETYGHHHRFGDMALSYALHALDRAESVRITNYGEYLALYPPAHEARIVENSSWSCAHGVERWRSDCGCAAGAHPGWNQRWREPLREALDWLRVELAENFEAAGSRVFQDPRAARDDYIAAVLDRSPASVDAFLSRHCRGPLDAEREISALKLLEMERHAQLMFTSCAWFFDEISGIETVQNLQYAARAMQLAEELFGRSVQAEFLDRLERAPSNVADYGNGRVLYENRVRPATVDLAKVGANAAASLLFDDGGTSDLSRGYEIELVHRRLQEAGRARLLLGRIRVASAITRERESFDFAFLHLGDHNLSGGVRAATGGDRRAFEDDICRSFSRGDLPGVLRGLEQHLGESTYSLQTLFRDEQRRIVDHILGATRHEAEAVQERLYHHHAGLLRFIAGLEMPPPRLLSTAAELVLNTRLKRELETTFDPETLRALLDDAKSMGVEPEQAGLGFAAHTALERMFDRFASDPSDSDQLERVLQAVALVQEMPFDVDLRGVQNAYYRLRESWPATSAAGAAEPRRRELFDELGITLGIAPR